MNEPLASDSTHAPAAAPGRSWRIHWRYSFQFIVVHLVALLAFVPWFFSWTGVILLVLGFHFFATLGINIGYHRLITHRGFSCPKWLEYSLAILGVCCLQQSPTVWAAWHRRHHHVADKEVDPHSPLKSFLWAYVGWLVIQSDNSEVGPLVDRYAADLQRDPFYAWLEKSENYFKIVLLSWALFFMVGFVAAGLNGGTTMDAVQFGLSLMVWGAAVRTVIVWHGTWSVNAVTHLWGYRNYDTPDNSRNNVFIGLLTSGEGWHNNHHADPRSPKHGHRRSELDVTWLTIRAFVALGLARDVALPSPHLAAELKARDQS